MFAHLNETVLKVVIIIAVLVMFLVLYTTGIAFVLGSYTTDNIILHKLAALIIIGLLSVHAWLRRCTIRRLLQECVAIFFNKHIHHEDNIDFIIHNTKNQTFAQLCLWFNSDISFLQQKLLENHVKIENVEDTLKTIAKYNDKDMYQIFLLMMKLHVEKNSPSPIYDASCSRM
ncbi:hypothetical protein [Sulfurospirillum oryzae]|uniref:hypothetical protein n=1 Tax=Sulfurospirillum oryzae TaxID=2976535 RepID=UPI0021E90CF8|nr:hypothetical protein [Sulfurospirillum oryzae]